MSLMPSSMLSACADHYAEAICQPFSPAAMGACVPKLPARMSEKTHGTLRFSVTVGTAGYGFLAFSPCVANNGTCVLYSGTTFAGTSTIGVTSATTGVETASMASLPYSSTNIVDSSGSGNPAVSARIVSAGVAIQYTGQNLTRGGVTRAYTDPNHSNLFGQDFAQNTAPGVAVQTVTERKHKYAISAIDTQEWEYSNGDQTTESIVAYPFSQGKIVNATDLQIGGAPFFWDVTSTPGNTFYVDIILHVEYIGRLASGRLTPSHADSVGFERVAAASAKVNSLRVSNPEASLSSLFRTALTEVARELAPLAVSGLKNSAGNLVRSYL